jgi:hypothetical protein
MGYRIALTLLIALPTAVAITIGFDLSLPMALLVGMSVGGFTALAVIAASK